jgi:hypothetical protein
MVVTLFVAVSILQTLLLSVVIYANDPLDEIFCTGNADPVEEMRIKNKIKIADANANQCILVSVFIYFLPFLSFIFHIKNVNILILY